MNQSFSMPPPIDDDRGTPPHSSTDTPSRLIEKGDYACDWCNRDDVKEFFLIQNRPKSRILLCPLCFAKSEWKSGAIIEIYKVVDEVVGDVDRIVFVNDELDACVRHYIKEPASNLKGVQFVYHRDAIVVLISRDQEKAGLKRDIKAVHDFATRFNLGKVQGEGPGNTMKYTLKQPSGPNPYFEMLKGAFDLLQDTSLLEDALCTMAADERDALYGHPFIRENNLDLLP